jgi:two-component system chemotaxis sensor kinase CheA
MSDYLDPNNEELLKDFFLEAELQVETLEQNILTLENDPGNKEAVDEIFRAAHTLKGAAATVQMNELAEFTHLCEDVLDEIRSEKVIVNEDVVDTLLNAIDIIKAILESRKEGQIFEEDISEISQSLQGFLNGTHGTSKQKKSEKKESSDSQSSSQETVSEYELLEMREAAGAGKSLYRVTVAFIEENPMNSVGGIQAFALLKKSGVILKTVPDFEELYQDKYFPEVDYFLGTELSESEVQDLLSLPDVISTIKVVPLNATEAASPPEPPAPSPAVKESSPPPFPVSSPSPSLNDASAGALSLEEGMDNDDDHGLKEPTAPLVHEARKSSSGSILRVDSRRIDNLLNLVSEAVITKASFNQISNLFGEIFMDIQSTETVYKEKLKHLFASLPKFLEDVQKGKPVKDVMKEINDGYEGVFTLFEPVQGQFKSAVSRFRSTSQVLARTTSELQEGVMQIRMVPIAQIFNRFPRLVRDVSRNLKKNVRLVIEGEDTELDKSVIDDLLDPLIHCVRNSVDHGLETPEERRAKGKPEEGTILLRASNEGNMIVIEISDDGKGIDVNAVHEKAVANGLIHPSKKLSDVEAFNLIFEPGFSTAKTVTNISGRGVGLDVVRKQIEKLNGTANVWSELGVGTRITIKLPLTLAIIQGLLIRVGDDTYAIPITSVLDSHRIKPSDIKRIDNYEVFNVRDEAVSLIRLSNLFKIPSRENGEYYYVVLVGTEEKKMGLMVDALIGEEDVVMKPLKDKYTNSPGIAGATILGDGTVSLIIDVSQLLELGYREEMAIREQRVANAR